MVRGVYEAVPLCLKHGLLSRDCYYVSVASLEGMYLRGNQVHSRVRWSLSLKPVLRWLVCGLEAAIHEFCREKEKEKHSQHPLL